MAVLDSDDLGLVALKASWATFAIALSESQPFQRPPGLKLCVNLVRC